MASGRSARIPKVTAQPFEIAVPDPVLDDLRARIARTRFSDRTPGPRWSAGTDPDYLAELLHYWADGFDWRARERWLNSHPQFIAEIDGQAVHFAHLRGVRRPGDSDPLPLGLTHGWPYSFVELMSNVLGYSRFGTYGEDIGAGVSDWLAATHADAVIGIHATHAADIGARRHHRQPRRPEHATRAHQAHVPGHPILEPVGW